MLDCVEVFLEAENIRWVRLDGSMTSIARDKAQVYIIVINT
jgi:hypothetical protein